MSIPGQGFPGGTIALGICVGILSTSAQSIGLTLQRKSHIIQDALPPVLRKPPHRCHRWQIGMGLFLAANLIGSSVQISTLPLPVLSTLQASGLVFNGLCATIILNEPFTQLSLIGTLLVCAGALLIAIFGAIPAPTHDLPELLALMHRPAFIAWMASTGAFVVFIAVATDVTAALTARSRAKSTPQAAARFQLGRGLAYGCISGILSAHSLLVAKSAVELIIKTVIDGDNQFVHWQAWGAVGALITFALVQLSYLHRGLRLVSTSVLYPLVFCVYNIIAILDGLIYFEQAECIPTTHALLIALGTLILLSGVLALSWRLHDNEDGQASPTSATAPIGFMSDTEEESLIGSPEESLIGSSPLASPISPTTPRTYATFGRRERADSYAEIWGDLQDEAPTSPIGGSLPRRGTRRQSLDETASLLPGRNRSGTVGSGRRKSGKVQSAVGGLFQLRWWGKGRDGRDGDE